MTYIYKMIKHKLEKNTVINKIVSDFIDTLCVYILLFISELEI